MYLHICAVVHPVQSRTFLLPTDEAPCASAVIPSCHLPCTPPLANTHLLSVSVDLHILDISINRSMQCNMWPLVSGSVTQHRVFKDHPSVRAHLFLRPNTIPLGSTTFVHLSVTQWTLSAT